LPGAEKLDWSLSQLNVDQQFTASVIYDLPFGRGKAFGANMGGVGNALLGNWQVNVITKATSGFPLFVVNSANGSDVNFQCVAPAQVHTLEHWFNPCAFEAAPDGELGNSPRAPMDGPKFVNVDFSAIKNFPLSFREGMLVQFRAEFFNLFNHPQFFLTGGSSGMQDINASTSFGVINGTVNNPRVIQFALKLNF
jgi:hypothetical protein